MTQPDPSPTKGGTRRQVLGRMAGGAALTWGVTPRAAAASPRDLHHVVLVTMENRSFDHFLGWVPGADGEQAGLTYRDAAGQPRPPLRWRPITRGAAIRTPILAMRGAHRIQCWRL